MKNRKTNLNRKCAKFCAIALACVLTVLSIPNPESIYASEPDANEEASYSYENASADVADDSEEDESANPGDEGESGTSNDGKKIDGKEIDVEGNVEEENCEEENSEDEILEDENSEIEISEDEILEEEISEDENSEDEILEDEISEEEISEDEILEEEIIVAGEMFICNSSAYSFTEEMASDKRELSAELGEYKELEEGRDIAEGEILIKAPDYETALKYAACFNGKLLKFRHGIATVELNADETLPHAEVYDALCASAKSDNRLPAAWPNTISYLTNDPLADKLDEFERYQWFHDVLGSEYALENGYNGDGVKVAVLDTGIRTGHEDFDWSEIEAVSVTDENDPDDSFTLLGGGHGTNVCGIIKGEYDNGLGGHGIAPEADLLSVKVFSPYDSDSDDSFDSVGAYLDDVLEGINLCIDRGDVDIINMSLGSNSPNPLYEEVIDSAYESGITVFAAAGNGNTNAEEFPASYKHAVSVAALNKDCKRTEFSNYGPKVRYAFPGAEIYSTYNQNDYGDVPGLTCDGYSYMDGTSQASPMAAACAAVILASMDSEGLSGPAKVDALLKKMDSSCVSTSESGMGKGYVNLTKAFGLSRMSEKPKAPVVTKNPGGTYKELEIDVCLSAQKGTDIYYTLDGTTPKLNSFRFNASTVKLTASDGKITLPVQEKVVLKAIAVNGAGLSSPVLTQKYVFKVKETDIRIYVKDGTTVSLPVGISKGSSLQLAYSLTPEFAEKTKINWSVDEFAAETGIKVSSKGLVSIPKNCVPDIYSVYAETANGNKTSLPIEVLDSIEYTFSGLSLAPEHGETTGIVYADRSNCFVISGKKKIKGEETSEDVCFSDFRWSVKESGVSISVNTVLNLNPAASVKKVTVVGTPVFGGKKVSFTFKTIIPLVGIHYSVDDKITVSAGGSYKLNHVVFQPQNASNKSLEYSVYRDDTPVPGFSFKKNVMKVAGDVEEGVSNLVIVSKENSIITCENEFYVKNKKIKKIEIDSENIPKTLLRNTGAYSVYGSQCAIHTEIVYKDGSKVSVEDAMKLVSVECDRPDIIDAALGITTSNIYVVLKAGAVASGKAKIMIKNLQTGKVVKSFTVKVVNPPSNMYIVRKNVPGSYLAYNTTAEYKIVFEEKYGKVDKSSYDVTWLLSKGWDIDSPYSFDELGGFKIIGKGKVKACSFEAMPLDENGEYDYFSDDDQYATALLFARTNDGTNLSYCVNVFGDDAIKEISVESNVFYTKEDPDENGDWGYGEMLLGFTPKHNSEDLYGMICSDAAVSVDKKSGMAVSFEGYVPVNPRYIGKVTYYPNKAGKYEFTIKMNNGDAYKKKIKVKITDSMINPD
ncbi:MAG: S8 family serine peptidase [Lachnospiraceae bacterium]|nr:S8 family serine peptidase [Lachnospiraceae bacterium]